MSTYPNFPPPSGQNCDPPLSAAFKSTHDLDTAPEDGSDNLDGLLAPPAEPAKNREFDPNKYRELTQKFPHRGKLKSKLTTQWFNHVTKNGFGRKTLTLGHVCHAAMDLLKKGINEQKLLRVADLKICGGRLTGKGYCRSLAWWNKKEDGQMQCVKILIGDKLDPPEQKTVNSAAAPLEHVSNPSEPLFDSADSGEPESQAESAHGKSRPKAKGKPAAAKPKNAAKRRKTDTDGGKDKPEADSDEFIDDEDLEEEGSEYEAESEESTDDDDESEGENEDGEGINADFDGFDSGSDEFSHESDEDSDEDDTGLLRITNTGWRDLGKNKKGSQSKSSESRSAETGKSKKQSTSEKPKKERLLHSGSESSDEAAPSRGKKGKTGPKYSKTTAVAAVKAKPKARGKRNKVDGIDSESSSDLDGLTGASYYYMSTGNRGFIRFL